MRDQLTGEAKMPPAEIRVPSDAEPAFTPAPRQVAETPAAEAAPKSRAAETSKPTETLRVDIERLDQLMNLAGQLVINEARFAQIGEKLKGALSNRRSARVFNRAFSALEKMTAGDGRWDDAAHVQAEMSNFRVQARSMRHDLEAVRCDLEILDQVRGSLNDLFESVHQLDRVSDGIQRSVMEMRMVPIGPLFNRFKRVVRDITHGNGKSVRLVINGEKTELDKRMIDELSDPLIHLVRNAADHGIELPEDREAAGKPREGTVTLDAFHRGNSIVIRVSDDGKGLDIERIRRKAIQNGLISEADAEKMTPRQIHALIWAPGLSTAEKVTEVSGRGMGMDIVKSKIDDLNGIVEIESELGRGTTISIKLPLTLAILPSLMVRIDDDVFAMPLESVVEIVRLKPSDLSTVCRQWTARVRGRVISMVRLRDVFSWAGAATARDAGVDDEVTLVILGQMGREIGLVVDHVLGEQDIVVKSLAENYRNLPGIAVRQHSGRRPGFLDP